MSDLGYIEVCITKPKPFRDAVSYNVTLAHDLAGCGQYRRAGPPPLS